MDVRNTATDPISHAAPPGLFVTLDGPGGVGKTTVSRLLADELRGRGLVAEATTEPTPTPLGRYIRDNADTHRGIALACLVAGDRHHHLSHMIEPAVRAGQVVICDRYLPSSLVLQVHDGVPASQVWQLNDGVLVPDLAVIMTAAPSLLNARLAARGAHNRFERDVDSSAREVVRFSEVSGDLRQRGWPVWEFDATSLEVSEAVALLVAAIVALLRARETGVAAPEMMAAPIQNSERTTP